MNEMILQIQVNENSSKHIVRGNSNVGMIKLMLGEIELIKKKLIDGLIESQKLDELNNSSNEP